MRRRLLIEVWLALALVITACASDDGDTAASGDDPASGPRNVIRFTFAPDPVWDYINDNGIREEMEQESGMRIVSQVTWDEFGLYGSGLTDIGSVGDFEVAVLDEQTGQQSVIFGKYNIQRSVIVVPSSDTTSQTLADLVGKRIAVFDTVSSTMIWGVLAAQLHDLDFRTGSGDFELIQVDITNTGPLAAEGNDVEAAVVLPDFAVNELSNGSLRVLYDGRTDSEVYAQDIVGNPAHEGPMSNVFIARKEWYDEHPDEVKFFLSLWERGIKEWQANRAEIIASYPQHFAVEGDEQVAFMQDWLDKHDWFVDTVYLTDQWVNDEKPLFDIMRDTGWMGSDEEAPIFDVVTP